MARLVRLGLVSAGASESVCYSLLHRPKKKLRADPGRVQPRQRSTRAGDSCFHLTPGHHVGRRLHPVGTTKSRAKLDLNRRVDRHLRRRIKLISTDVAAVTTFGVGNVRTINWPSESPLVSGQPTAYSGIHGWAIEPQCVRGSRAAIVGQRTKQRVLVVDVVGSGPGDRATISILDEVEIP